MSEIENSSIFVCDPDIESWQYIQENVNTALGITRNYADHQNSLDTLKPLHFSETPFSDLEKRYDYILIFVPKGHEYAQHTFLQTQEHLSYPCDIVVLGQKKAGVATAIKKAKVLWGEAVFKDNANHCSLSKFSYIPSEERDQSFHTFKSYELEILDQKIDIYNIPGCFQYGQLDIGTKLLLEVLHERQDKQSPENILDMGCGGGDIAVTCSYLWPESKIDAVDTALPAILSTKMTVGKNNRKNISVFASNIFSAVKHKYDLVVSNLPFHQNHKVTYDVIERFFAEVDKYLSKRGSCLVVMHNNVPYKKFIKDGFYSKLLIKKDGFSVVLFKKHRGCD